jgi:hypothetical protein
VIIVAYCSVATQTGDPVAGTISTVYILTAFTPAAIVATNG